MRGKDRGERGRERGGERHRIASQLISGLIKNNFFYSIIFLNILLNAKSINKDVTKVKINKIQILLIESKIWRKPNETNGAVECEEEEE